MRVFERDLSDGGCVRRHFRRRGEITIDGIAECGQVAEAGSAGGCKKCAPGGGVVGGGLWLVQNNVFAHDAAPFIGSCSIGFCARATTETSQPMTPRPRHKEDQEQADDPPIGLDRPIPHVEALA